jgi:NAD(P)-dependent dehydrogenase (short-subunit alcohol dehydrogenase family)
MVDTRCAVVVGAGSRPGAEVAKRFATEGLPVVAQRPEKT